MIMKFFSYYFDGAVFDLADVIEQARTDLKDVGFDTVVGTGFSGGIVIPALALAMEKKFVLIRKEGDDSHHGGGRLVGELGQRWLFVDDFVATGRTRTRVIEKISDSVAGLAISTAMVGQYMYGGGNPGFKPFDPAWRNQ